MLAAQESFQASDGEVVALTKTGVIEVPCVQRKFKDSEDIVWRRGVTLRAMEGDAAGVSFKLQILNY